MIKWSSDRVKERPKNLQARRIARMAAAFAVMITLITDHSTTRPLLYAASSNVGTSGAQFLKIPPGARPAGMGSAFSAVADDVHAIYYNPAGLAAVSQVQLTGMHNSYFQGLNYEFAAIALPLSRFGWDGDTEDSGKGTLGLAVYNLSVSGIERRGNAETAAPLGTFGADDFAYALSYARGSERFAWGANLKFIQQTIDSVKAGTLAADLGALYGAGENLKLGAGVRHLGGKPKFRQESDPLPMLGFLAASYRLAPGAQDSLTLGLDLLLPRDNRLTYNVGSEYLHRFASMEGALRAGYSSQNADADGLAGFSMGGGLGFRNVGFDFAWVPFGDLGDTFRYSLIVKF